MYNASPIADNAQLVANRLAARRAIQPSTEEILKCMQGGLMAPEPCTPMYHKTVVEEFNYNEVTKELTAWLFIPAVGVRTSTVIDTDAFGYYLTYDGCSHDEHYSMDIPGFIAESPTREYVCMGIENFLREQAIDAIMEDIRDWHSTSGVLDDISDALCRRGCIRNGSRKASETKADPYAKFRIGNEDTIDMREKQYGHPEGWPFK